ncbi:MAG: hypothetical protein ACYDC2_02835 [Solirubrobacteraceae bacterium]
MSHEMLAHPTLLITIARQNVLALRRSAARGRAPSAVRVGGAYRLPDGSWMRARRESS